MTNDHGSRGHARWSASSTARNTNCAGALALSQNAPGGKESIHSAMGTAVHQVSERCLREGRAAIEFLDTIEKTKEHEIPMTEELCNSAQMYVDYVNERVAEGGKLQLEQYFSLVSLGTPFNAGGTGDAVIYFAQERLLEIVDLKNGMSTVDVNENGQLRTYGLGAVLANPDLDVERVKVTIVQPRAPHRDGRIRSEEFTIGELVEWTSWLLGKMRTAKQAEDALPAAEANSVLFDEWVETYLKPGSWCYFCPNSGPCPAQRRLVMDKVKMFLDDPEPVARNRPSEMSPEALADTLDLLPVIEQWVKDVRAHAHRQAEEGTDIPRYQLADKIGNRKWSIEDEHELAQAVMKATGLQIDQVLTTPSVRSPAQIEKLLPKAQHEKVSGLTVRPVTGTNLVSQIRTTRPPAPNRVERFLDPST